MPSGQKRGGGIKSSLENFRVRTISLWIQFQPSPLSTLSRRALNGTCLMAQAGNAQNSKKQRKTAKNCKKLRKTALPKLWNFLGKKRKTAKNGEKLQKNAENTIRRVPLSSLWLRPQQVGAARCGSNACYCALLCGDAGGGWANQTTLQPPPVTLSFRILERGTTARAACIGSINAFRPFCSQLFCQFWQCVHWKISFFAQVCREIWRLRRKQERQKKMHLFRCTFLGGTFYYKIGQNMPKLTKRLAAEGSNAA